VVSQEGDQAVSFVTDEDGTSYGSGTVARGGTAEASRGGGAPSPGSPSARLSPAAPSRARSASLSATDPCRGFFPRSASEDTARVTVLVELDARGATTRVRVVEEEPAGQGFAEAAQRCLEVARFEPALDGGGTATSGELKLTIRFTR
jgi:TonB family protein